MNLTEAKKILNNNNYIVYHNFLGESTVLNEASAVDMLKKIPEVLKKFKNRVSDAKQTGDKEELKSVVSDAKELKQEINDKGVLDQFKNSNTLRKVIFTTIAALMLSAGATNAFAGGSSTLRNNYNKASIDQMWQQMDTEIDAACKATGQDSNHCRVIQHKGPVNVDKNTDDDIVLKTANKEIKHTRSGEEVVAYTVELQDMAGNSGGYWTVILSDNGDVYLNQDQEHPKFDKMNKSQLKWMQTHGFDLRN